VARSVDHLLFSGNKITYTNTRGSGKPAVNLTACKNVVIDKNCFDAADVEPVVTTSKMTKKDLETDLGVRLLE
jgi:polygalacturonase